jgi:hypothetical protein
VDDNPRSDQKGITVSGLTRATTYEFQVQALGVLGYSDWSAIETIICIQVVVSSASTRS